MCSQGITVMEGALFMYGDNIGRLLMSELAFDVIHTPTIQQFKRVKITILVGNKCVNKK